MQSPFRCFAMRARSDFSASSCTVLPCRSAYERRTRCRHGRAMHTHAAHTPFPCVSSRYAHGLLVHGAWTHCQRVASQMSVRAPSGTQSQGLQSLPRAGVGRTPPGSAQPGSWRCRAPRGRGAPCRPLSSGVAVPQCPWCSLRLTARMFPWGGGRNWRFTMRVNVFVL